jgi:hypothetical protein
MSEAKVILLDIKDDLIQYLYQQKCKKSKGDAVHNFGQQVTLKYYLEVTL